MSGEQQNRQNQGQRFNNGKKNQNQKNQNNKNNSSNGSNDGSNINKSSYSQKNSYQPLQPKTAKQVYGVTPNVVVDSQSSRVVYTDYDAYEHGSQSNDARSVENEALGLKVLNKIKSVDSSYELDTSSASSSSKRYQSGRATVDKIEFGPVITKESAMKEINGLEAKIRMCDEKMKFGAERLEKCKAASIEFEREVAKLKDAVDAQVVELDNATASDDSKVIGDAYINLGKIKKALAEATLINNNNNSEVFSLTKEIDRCLKDKSGYISTMQLNTKTIKEIEEKSSKKINGIKISGDLSSNSKIQIAIGAIQILAYLEMDNSDVQNLALAVDGDNARTLYDLFNGICKFKTLADSV